MKFVKNLKNPKENIKIMEYHVKQSLAKCRVWSLWIRSASLQNEMTLSKIHYHMVYGWWCSWFQTHIHCDTLPGAHLKNKRIRSCAGISRWIFQNQLPHIRKRPNHTFLGWLFVDLQWCLLKPHFVCHWWSYILRNASAILLLERAESLVTTITSRWEWCAAGSSKSNGEKERERKRTAHKICSTWYISIKHLHVHCMTRFVRSFYLSESFDCSFVSFFFISNKKRLFILPFGIELIVQNAGTEWLALKLANAKIGDRIHSEYAHCVNS